MKAFELEAEMTEQQADNVIAMWEHTKSEKLDSAKSLMRLGDSKILAVATVMVQVNHSTEMYKEAYYS